MLISIVIAFSHETMAQYCTSTASNGDFEYISKVTIGDIDNQTGSNLYTDYSTALSTDLYIGETYGLTIISEEYYVVDNFACWIDWNQNETFESNELVTLNVSGVPSKQATITANVTPPSDAVIGKTKMRILLVSDEVIDPCLAFTYGEVEDYAINVIGIDAPPSAAFSSNKRVIYAGESVEFNDLSTLVPTSWNWIISPATVSFIESTDANSENPVITFNESGNYTITLEATNAIGTDDTVMVDYIQVKDFGKPRNVKASSEGKHVNLTWNAPNISGIYDYIETQGATYVINPGPQRATRYSAEDFNFSYPVTVTQISGFFAQSTEVWDDSSFEFKIYDQDTTTVLYESGILEAQHNKEIIHSLSSPLVLNNDFYLAIIPVSTSNFPSNTGVEVAPYKTHTYVGEPGSWWQFTDETIAIELATSIYIAGDKSNGTKWTYTSNDEKSASKEQVNFTLSSYEVYRDGSLVKEIQSLETVSFVDKDLANGDYSYYVKALYSPFGTSPASEAVNITVDNTDAEISLLYNSTELISGQEIELENNVMIGVTKTLTFSVYNEGQNDLNISDISIDLAEFQVKNAPTVIVGGATETFTVEFTPETDGVKNATLTISNDDSNENPFTVKIRAVGGMDKWTWMIYLLEDNTGLNGAKDINEWEVNGSVEGQVNYLVLYDSDDDSKDGIWYITKDPDGFNYQFVSEKVSSHFGLDPDMSDPATLEEFLLWVKDNYPAQNYGLTMWDHGSGIFKKSNNNEYGIQKDFVGDMKLWEMSKAVETFVNITGQKINVIGFDVCLLGQFETAYQFSTLADYVIASELTEPGDGWNYWAAFEPMTTNPDITPEEIAISITNTYTESYQPGGWQNRQASTQAATSIKLMNEEFLPVFNDFSLEMGNLCYDFKNEISRARYSAWAAISIASNSEQNPDHRDLGGFLKSLSGNYLLPDHFRTLAENTLDKYEKMVVAEGHTESLTNGATGLKIWIPETMSTEGNNKVYYNDPVNYLHISNTNWDEFLTKFENPTNSVAPKAEFYVQDTVEQGATIELLNRSYYGPTSYSWEITPASFEYLNGTNESSKTPKVKFKEKGKYTIQLTASNAQGSDAQTQNECIVVVDADLVAPSDLTYSQDENEITLNWNFTMGQAGLSEGFENLTSFPPAGWSIKSNNSIDGANLEYVEQGANTWGWCDENTFKKQNGDPDPQYMHTGDYAAAIGYTAGSTGDKFNWLITPSVDITDGQSFTFWLWYASDADYYTDFDVLIYSDDTWTSLLHLTDGSGVNLYEEQIVLSLADYANKTVKLAFVYQYTDGYQLAIDDILITSSKSIQRVSATKSDKKYLRNAKMIPAKKKLIESKGDYVPASINIYRNDAKIGQVDDINQKSYTDVVTANGTYKYHVTVNYSQPDAESKASNSVNVSVNTITGIDFASTQNLIIYPNPASDYVNVELPEVLIQGQLQIIDLTGKVIFEKQISQNNSSFNVSDINQGMYLIKLRCNTQEYTNRLLIK